MVLNSKQNLQEALEKLRDLAKDRKTLFNVWTEKFPDKNFEASEFNKGKDGQLVELILEMSLSPDLNDFIDGELKTCGTIIDDRGNLQPKETMAITQIASLIDEMLSLNATTQFEDSRLYKKN